MNTNQLQRERDFYRHRADELDAELANTKRQLQLAQRRLRLSPDPSAKDHMDALQRSAQRQSFADAINGR